MKEIYYATGNSVKFEEAQSFIAKHLSQVNLKQCAEEFDEIQSLDQKAIVLNKALQAYSFLKKPVLADDAGIYFDQYSQFPGTLTKFVYQAIGLAGIFKLMEPNQKASFRISLAFIKNLNDYIIFESQVSGTIIHIAPESINKQIPFDQIFVPDNQDKSLAQLRKEDNFELYNYRAHALKKFCQWFDNSNEISIQPERT